jgi:hypothetical protein
MDAATRHIPLLDAGSVDREHDVPPGGQPMGDLLSLCAGLALAVVAVGNQDPGA